MALYQAGKVSGPEVLASDRFANDWSRGTGHPGRMSEMRSLGVSLDSAAFSDGIATSIP